MAFKSSVAFLFFILCLKVGAQQFQATYGGPASDIANDICATADGGYVTIGSTTSFGAGNKDIYLIKINSIGGLIWSKTFGGANNDEAESINTTSDGGYIITGSTNSFGAGNYDFYLIKTDSVGTIEWSKTFGGSLEDRATFGIQTFDGGYTMVGRSQSFSLGYEDVYLVHTDSTGILLWSNQYGCAGQDNPSEIKQTMDSGYIVSGFASYNDSITAMNITDNFLLKIDSAGIVEWYKTFGGTGPDFGNTVEQCADLGFIQSVNSTAGNFSHLIKTSPTGSIIWYKQFLGISFGAIRQTTDFGFIVSGIKTVSMTDNDALLLRLNSSGSVLWSKSYGWIGDENGNDCFQTTDGGFVLSGSTTSFGIGSDFFIIKTDSIGNSGCNEIPLSLAASPGPAETAPPILFVIIPATVENTALTITGSGGVANILCYTGFEDLYSEKENIIISPNPTTGQFNFSNLDNNSTIRIYDCLGKLILQTVLKDNEQVIDISNKEKGIYFYRIENQIGEFSSGKFILQ